MKISAAAVFLSAVTCSLITGCSGSPAFPNVEANASSSSESDTASGVLKGRLHGGQQPIVGAKIYLLAAGTTGYGSASTSLLTAASYPGYTAQKDGNGNYYVTTDVAGSFQIVDNCTPGQQVYVASVGGNPGAGNNTAANEIAILGQCPSAGNFDGTLTGVYVSEISTVAAAYAASAYATDTFHIGGPSTTTLQGSAIANAFANAANLFDIQNINDVARPSTLGGNGTVPRTKIHTLANILAACINSTGPSSPACSILFSNAKSGGTAGTAPTDVVTSAINIAHNPWANVSSLLPLQTAISPFSPQMASSGSSAPSDFALTLDFPNAALGSNPSLAVDGSGNVWSLVPGQAAVAKLSPQGTLLSGSTGYVIGGGFTGARAFAFDTNKSLWVLGQGNNSGASVATFAQLSSTGVYSQTITQAATLASNPPAAGTNLVIDGAGNFYYGSLYVYNIAGIHITLNNCCTVKYNPTSGGVSILDAGNTPSGPNFVALNNSAAWATGTGSSLSFTSGMSKSVMGGGLNGATGVALDNSGDAWVVNAGNSTVSEFNSTGTAVSTSNGFMGGLSAPAAIAVDGLGAAWVTNSGGSFSLTPFTSGGAVVGKGYTDPNLSSAGSMAIDASGNVWVGSSTSNTISEFVGVAAPVVTPTAAAIGGGFVGARP